MGSVGILPLASRLVGVENLADWEGFLVENTYVAYLFSMRKAPSMPRLVSAALVALVLVAATTGCRMGGNPLDCCGPVYCGGTIPPCAQDVRAGSILSPPAGSVMQPAPVEGEVIPEAESSPEPTPAPTPAPKPSASEPSGSWQPAPAPAESPFVEEPSQPEAWQPASSDGWVPRGHG